ncbi:ArsR/SmtB family transcription factor [Crocosphaera sp. Alani8]|uniref:ArsR/SmtB family transcription factor n=1 Tax=Crocosphaera sp. Alani8 TaxID=3038952 RepID=UPI00313EE2D5
MAIATPHNSSIILLGFRALSDPIRLKVLALLKGQELCVCDLCKELDVNQSKLSFHLKNLKDAQLVQARQEGRWIYYRLNQSQFTLLQNYLSEYQKFDGILSASPCE